MADLVCDGGQISLTEIIEGVNGRVDEEGGTMTGPLVVPSIVIGGEQLSPYSNKNKLVNTSFKVNQRKFDSNWGAKANGEYGYDRWYKSAGGISQVIPDGYYSPSTTYTLSGNNITEAQIVSPSTGNWAIEVPVSAGNIQLEEGVVASTYDEPHLIVVIQQCKFFYETIQWNEIGTIAIDGSSGSAIFSVIYTDKHKIPAVSFETGEGTAESLWSCTLVGTGSGVGTLPHVQDGSNDITINRAKCTLSYVNLPTSYSYLSFPGITNENNAVTKKSIIIVDAEVTV